MAQVFGQPASNNVASSILGNQTLNVNPSPAMPQTVPTDNLKVQYERLLWASYQVRKVETDNFRLQELEQCIQFAERVCQELGLKKDEIVPSAGPPAQTPPSTSVAPAMGAPRPPTQVGAPPPQPPPGAPQLGPSGPPPGSPG